MAATAVKAQKSVPFKLKFLPNHTYTVTGNTITDSRINSVGNANKKGASKPALQNKGNVSMSYVIKTGPVGAGGNFPFNVTVTNFSSKNVVNGVVQPGPKNNPVVGAISRGKCTPDGQMHTQSISFPNADAKTQKTVLSMVNKLGDEIKFPNRPMKIGESFTQEKPFSVASGQKNIGIKTTVTYTLKAIKGNLAYFDTKEAIAMDVTGQKPDKKVDMKTNGKGKGTMVYDIANNLAIAKADNLDMKMDMHMGAMTMAIDANAVTSYKATISGK
ncbi:hypothetical protein GCM10022392_30880 [Mucilaginibacter panaciglaebae]|uniref:Uncharacterized protein n=2 Tax=Mucilaginibacter panaciglaebae TaxID=502331 RepID=A0ABP7X3R4_9SPHI